MRTSAKSPFLGKNSAAYVCNIGPKKRLKFVNHFLESDFYVFFEHDIRFFLYHVVVLKVPPSMLYLDVYLFIAHLDDLLIVLQQVGGQSTLCALNMENDIVVIAQLLFLNLR